MSSVACVYTCWMFLPWDQESSTEVCDIIFWALGTPVAWGFCPTQSSNHSVPNHTHHTNIHIHQTFKNRINILRILLFKVFNLWIYVVSTFTQNLIFVSFFILNLYVITACSEKFWSTVTGDAGNSPGIPDNGLTDGLLKQTMWARHKPAPFKDLPYSRWPSDCLASSSTLQNLLST